MTQMPRVWNKVQSSFFGGKFHHGNKCGSPKGSEKELIFSVMDQLAKKIYNLVGGFNPSEKYARQIGFIFPNFRGENSKNI